MNRHSTLKTKTPLRAKKPWGSTGSILKRTGTLATRTPLKSTTSLKAKKNIKKVGKIGKANKTARGLIADYAKKMKLDRCELNFEGCTKTWPLAPAHRYPRSFYKGDIVLLADPKQWVVACVTCHNILDRRTEESKKLTEEVFIKLRGGEYAN